MSVTFSVDQDVISYTLVCGCGGSSSESVATFVEVDAPRDGFVYTCGDDYCAVYAPFAVPQYAEEAVEVNVSNINARYLLEMLGFSTDDLCGTAVGDDFLGRVLVAQGLSVGDPGVPVTVEGNFVDCGRPVGYGDVQLDKFRMMADFAVKNGKNIQWG